MKYFIVTLFLNCLSLSTFGQADITGTNSLNPTQGEGGLGQGSSAIIDLTSVGGVCMVINNNSCPGNVFFPAITNAEFLVNIANLPSCMSVSACGPGITGVCGTEHNGTSAPTGTTPGSCAAGTYDGVGIYPVAIGGWSWGCLGSAGGATAACSSHPDNINGVCGSENGGTTAPTGTNPGSCSAGTFVSLPSPAADSWVWRCDSPGAGSSANCSSAVASVQGVCDNTQLNSCVAGTMVDIGDTVNHYLWRCESTGGATANPTTCSAIIPACGTAAGESYANNSEIITTATNSPHNIANVACYRSNAISDPPVEPLIAGSMSTSSGSHSWSCTGVTGTTPIACTAVEASGAQWVQVNPDSSDSSWKCTNPNCLEYVMYECQDAGISVMVSNCSGTPSGVPDGWSFSESLVSYGHISHLWCVLAAKCVFWVNPSPVCDTESPCTEIVTNNFSWVDVSEGVQECYSAAAGGVVDQHIHQCMNDGSPADFFECFGEIGSPPLGASSKGDWGFVLGGEYVQQAHPECGSQENTCAMFESPIGPSGGGAPPCSIP